MQSAPRVSWHLFERRVGELVEAALEHANESCHGEETRVGDNCLLNLANEVQRHVRSMGEICLGQAVALCPKLGELVREDASPLSFRVGPRVTHKIIIGLFSEESKPLSDQADIQLVAGRSGAECARGARWLTRAEFAV